MRKTELKKKKDIINRKYCFACSTLCIHRKMKAAAYFLIADVVGILNLIP